MSTLFSLGATTIAAYRVWTGDDTTAARLLYGANDKLIAAFHRSPV